jgi:hypothetical protein
MPLWDVGCWQVDARGYSGGRRDAVKENGTKRIRQLTRLDVDF